MKIQSIQVGTPKVIEYKGHQILTGILKKKIAGPVLLKKLNLEGDAQADLSVHGGKDKALYAYSCDAYEGWRKLRPQDSFDNGAMGENLSVDHLPEDKIYIGDTFEIGTCVVQVTQPRFPCYKLAAKFNDPLIVKQFMKFERPGVYFRVIKEGAIEVDQELKLTHQEKIRVSVHELFIHHLERQGPAPG
jgi:MOSC domain-containing protein YiiM